jgi:hypothetical protein
MFSGVGFHAGMSSTSKHYKITAPIRENIGGALLFREPGRLLGTGLFRPLVAGLELSSGLL